MLIRWCRQMESARTAEKVMIDLMNDPKVSPDAQSFDTLINGYRCCRWMEEKLRVERMYFWLCMMRDRRLQPTEHTAKHFRKMGLHFPAEDGPFWTTDFGMPFDPRRHGRRRR